MITKKIFATIMAAVLLCGSTACAGAHQDSGTGTDSQPQLSPSAPTHPAEESASGTEAPVPTEAPTAEPTEAETAAPTASPTEGTTEVIPSTAELSFTIQNTAGEGFADVYSYDFDYPEVSGDPANDEKFNELITHEIARLHSYADELTLMECSHVSMHMDCNVTLNDEHYLSVLWAGDYFIEKAPHPVGFVHSVVIDKQTMETVYLGHFYDYGEEFDAYVNLLVEDLLVPTLAERLGVTETELYDAGVTGSFSSYGYHLPMEDMGTGRSFWLTEEGLVLPVDVLHVYGDYCPIVIPFDKLTAFEAE